MTFGTAMGKVAGAAALAATLPWQAGAQGYPPAQGYQDYQDGGYAGQPGPQNGYPQSGYPQSGYPQNGYPQNGYAPQGGYPPQDGEDDGYGQPGPGPDGYAGGPPPGYDTQAPPGYDGSQPPPPPPGYRAEPGYDTTTADRQYQNYAEDWAQRYCRRAPNNAGGGAVVGGILGALTGSVLAGRGGHGAGAVLGGVGGAAIGAGVGSTSRHQTSPGCPPGYVAVGGAPAFAYPGYGPQPYLYAAPAWYRPWVFYGGRWTYRPYPYHVWYARRFGPGPYGRPGFYRPPPPRPW